ncbi:MAG: GFA family protein [Gammaproteobacteria bacterium]|nr:GFA family protein [Gammaproteobacteria bacterium]
MNTETIIKGGCLCGAIRYSISAPPFEAEYCHCHTCQKSVGSVVVSWVDFYTNQFSWTAGMPAEYQSSENVMRGFCSDCGTSLSFCDSRYPEYITLTTASLDDPDLFEPTYHIYHDSKVKWLTIDDNCDRFTKDKH